MERRHCTNMNIGTSKVDGNNRPAHHHFLSSTCLNSLHGHHKQSITIISTVLSLTVLTTQSQFTHILLVKLVQSTDPPQETMCPLTHLNASFTFGLPASNSPPSAKHHMLILTQVYNCSIRTIKRLEEVLKILFL
jgi:hypothetical protein